MSAFFLMMFVVPTAIIALAFWLAKTAKEK